MTEEVQFFHHTSSNAKNIYNRKMDTKKFASPQFNYRDTGTAKLHVFIVEMLHERQCAQVLAHKSAQYAVTGTMQNAHAVNIAHYGIVKEIAHCPELWPPAMPLLCIFTFIVKVLERLSLTGRRNF